MRKKKQMLLVPSSGIVGGGLASSRSQAPAALLEGMAENPIYSPDDSLAKAASKLQSLKALRASVPHPRPAAPAAELAAAPPAPAPQACDSPRLQEEAGRHAAQASDAGQQLR